MAYEDEFRTDGFENEHGEQTEESAEQTEDTTASEKETEKVGGETFTLNGDTLIIEGLSEALGHSAYELSFTKVTE